MAKFSIVKGATSVLVRIFVQDSTSTTGAGKTGLTAASFTGTKCYVARDDDGNAAGTAVTLVDSTRGTWSSGGIKEKDATNMPGVYEFGLTNASLATGSRSCNYFLGGTGLVPTLIEIELTGPDNQVATQPVNVTQWNGTNVASPATAGIPDVNAKNINNVSTSSVTTINANQGTTQPINFTGTGASALVKSDTIDWNSVGVGGMPNSTTPPTTTAIATAVWQDSTAGDFTVASSIGKSLYTSGVVPGAAGGLFIAGSNAATTVNFTGTITTATNLTNLPSIPANWLTAAGINAGALNGKGDWYVSGAVLSESYSTSTFTIEQALYEIAQKVGQFSISGTTLTFQKRDKTTAAGTDTLNDATNPTSRTRAT